MKLKITVISLSLLLLACSCSIFYSITGFKPESIRGMNYLQEAQTTEQMIDFIVYCYYVGGGLPICGLFFQFKFEADIKE